MPCYQALSSRRAQRLSPFFLILLLLCLAASGCSGKKPSGSAGPASYTVSGKTYHVLPSASGYEETGMASWYGPGFNGRKTASGERFNQKALTAAHKTLPFGTKVRVENLANGREVVVRINDRGPFSRKRIIDLSKGAAQKLGMIGSGTARVRVTALEGGGRPPALTGRTAGPGSGSTAPEATGLFYIQAGSFSSMAQAEAVAGDMRARGYGCRIARQDRESRHLVQLGPYVSRADAEKEAQRLRGDLRGLFIVAE